MLLIETLLIVPPSGKIILFEYSVSLCVAIIPVPTTNEFVTLLSIVLSLPNIIDDADAELLLPITNELSTI